MLRVCFSAKTCFLIVTVSVIFYFSGATASEISFDDLPDPRAQQFDDPFRSLRADQLDSLRRVVRYQSDLENHELVGNARAKLEGRLSRLLKSLTASGIDPESLLAQRWTVAQKRRTAANAGNRGLEGKMVTISGFVIPAPVDANGVVTAYLVPERGMCSHTPPPPPNQLLRLALSSGSSPKSVYEPVRVTGKLTSDPMNRRFNVVDGETDMASTFRLDVTDVEPLLPFATSARIPMWPVKPGETYPPVFQQ